MLDRLTIERLEAAAAGGPILIALSGGGDSLALLHLMADRCGPARLRAAIVDHALRPGSEVDAARAQAAAVAIGVTAEVLTLSWDANTSRAQSAARDQRYRALTGAARRHGACVIATGHTRDDQAETVLLRAARDSGWRGLAGMRALAPAPIWPEGRGLWLARPLLSARRDDLRTLLRERGACWIEDPANANPNFARVRARAVLSELQAEGLDPMRLAALAERLATHADALDQAALALIESAVAFADDVAVIDLAAWRGAEAVRERTLAVLIAAASGQARPPAADGVEAELTRTGAVTLGGALLRRNRDAIRISRDPGALTGRADGAKPPPPLVLAPDVEAVWDGRLAVFAREPGWSVIVERGVPVLARGAARQSIAAASPKWLLQQRVWRLLTTLNFSAAFIPP